MKEKLVSLAKSRYFIPTIMMMVSLSLVAYAVTSVSVHNTVTITSGASVQIIYQTTPFTGNCPTTGYSPNPTGPFLVTEPANGTANTYVCIQNIGTSSDNPTIFINGPNPTTCTPSPCFSLSTSTLSPIPAGQIEGPVTITIKNNYASAQASSIDLAITVT